MVEYAIGFMREIGFDDVALKSLSADLSLIYGNESSRKIFQDCIDAYEKDINIDFKAYNAKVDEAADIVGVHHYSAELLLYICYSKHLRKVYQQRGIDDSIWFDSMCDLKWKLWECQMIKGIQGSFVAHWFGGFFNMTRFALGRLQFEVIPFNSEYNKNGRVLTPESKVINIHIPRTLTPFNQENCDNAIKQAAEFFEKELDGAPIVFHCSSWLLSDVHYKILHEKSNVRRFMDRFDIISFGYNKEGEHPDAWRVFDMEFTGNYNDFPEDSFIRRAYKEHIMKGGITGRGRGIFFYER